MRMPATRPLERPAVSPPPALVCKNFKVAHNIHITNHKQKMKGGTWNYVGPIGWPTGWPIGWAYSYHLLLSLCQQVLQHGLRRWV